jgi:hypothetical protein
MALRQASMTESTVTLPPVLQGVVVVPSYRVYLFDRANHSRPMKTIEYTGDQEAIQKASQFVDRHDVELWERSRFVMRFPYNPKKNSMPSKAQSSHAKRLFQWKQEGVKASSEYEAKEQATRLLTAKLRAERLAREAMSGKRDQKKSAKAQAENHRLAAIAAGRCRMPVKLDERRH